MCQVSKYIECLCHWYGIEHDQQIYVNCEGLFLYILDIGK